MSITTENLPSALNTVADNESRLSGFVWGQMQWCKIRKWIFHMHFYFQYDSRVLLKVKPECVPLLIPIVLVWSTQPWCSGLLNLSVKEPVLLPLGKEIMKIPKVVLHLLTVENALTAAF